MYLLVMEVLVATEFITVSQISVFSARIDESFLGLQIIFLELE